MLVVAFAGADLVLWIMSVLWMMTQALFALGWPLFQTEQGYPAGAGASLPSRAGSGGVSGRLNQNVDPVPLALWTPTCP